MDISQTHLKATYRQSEGSSTLGIDQKQGWNGGNDLNRAVAQRRIQGLSRCIADPLEDA